MFTLNVVKKTYLIFLMYLPYFNFMRKCYVVKHFQFGSIHSNQTERVITQLNYITVVHGI